jgi:hypothetical protein
MPFGRRPPLGTLFETRARLIPSTSPTCFFTDSLPDEVLVAVDLLRPDIVSRDFARTVVRFALLLRPIDFFAKVSPFAGLNDARALYAHRAPASHA